MRFRKKGTIAEKVFLKNVVKKSPELDMYKLALFFTNWTRLHSVKTGKVSLFELFESHIRSTHLKNETTPHKSPAGHPCPASVI